VIVIEACVESLDAAVAAEAGGAQRIELCSNLAEGGVSPDSATLAACVAQLTIPIVVMVRPRAGNFTYSAIEHAVMLEEIRRTQDAGAHGIVTGALRPDGTIDHTRAAELVAAARPLPVTFHRAFDECRDAARALETVIALGASRVLTSGQGRSAPDGAAAIAQLVRLAAERITIVAGGGINGKNVAALVRASGVREVHLSTKDADKVRKVADALKR
jgi:copper homeostasis protein